MRGPRGTSTGTGRLRDGDGLAMFAPDAIAIDDATGCWVWQGLMYDVPVAGYGGRIVSVRRWAYERTYGTVPAGATVRRTCGNARCVNPRHATAVMKQPIAGRIVRLESVGVLEDDGRRVRCVLCGNLYANLALHVRKAHDITPDRYREVARLPPDMPLASERFREDRRVAAARVHTPPDERTKAARQRLADLRADPAYRAEERARFIAKQRRHQTPELVAEIRAAKGSMTKWAAMRTFGVGRKTVERIWAEGEDPT